MQDLRRQIEIIPVKDSHTRIKPLALASGHGHYITITHPNGHLRTVSLPRRLRNDRFTSKTAVRRFQKRNGYLDPEVVKKNRWGF
jgi:hypothetical protein